MSEYEGYDWNQHTHQTNRGGVVRTYTMPYLWEKSKDLPVVEMNPEDIPEFEFLMQCDAADIWARKTKLGKIRQFHMEDFHHHAWRVHMADLSYPIILNPEGGMMDGVHRLMKARLEGVKVRVVRFDEWPEPNLTWDHKPLDVD